VLRTSYVPRYATGLLCVFDRAVVRLSLGLSCADTERDASADTLIGAEVRYRALLCL